MSWNWWQGVCEHNLHLRIPSPHPKNLISELFIFESRETGEFEPGPEGEDLQVSELDLHQYADMSTLKTNLDSATYDKVRNALGLEPLQQAIDKGLKITDNVRNNLE